MYNAAFAAGSRDQTIRTCYAGLLWADGQNEPALEEFSSLAIVFDDEKAAPVYGMLFRAWHWSLSRIQKSPERPTRIRQYRLINAIVEFLASDEQNENLRCSWKLLRDTINGFDTLGLRSLLAAMMERDEISLYNKHLVAGQFCLATAWDRRGDGFANTVAPDGWKGFQQFMVPARRHFERAWQLHPELADAPSFLIRIAMTGFAAPSWTTRDWFLQTVSAEFDFAPAYQNIRWASRPRWGGSHEQLLEFGRECIKTEAWKTSVPLVAIHTINDLKTELPIEERLASFSSIATLAREFAEGHSTALVEMKDVWKISKSNCDTLLQILIENDDFMIASSLLEQYSKYYKTEAAKNSFATQRMIGELQVMQSDSASNSKEIAEVRELLKSAESTAISVDLATRFKNAVATVRAEVDQPEARAVLNHYEEQVRQRLEFEKGDWVDIGFAEGIPGWRLLAGEINIVDENKALIDRTAMNRRAIIELANEYEFPLMLEATFKVIDADAKPNQHVEVGINLGAVETGIALHRRRCFFGIEPNLGVLSYDNSTHGKQVMAWDLPLVEQSNRIRIEYWKTAAIVYVNDQPVNLFVDLDVQPGSLFSFGPFLNSNTAACTFELSDVRIRKLSDSKDSRLLEYQQAQLEADPDNPVRLTNYARALRSAGQSKKAAEYIKQSLAIDPTSKASRLEHQQILFSNREYQASVAVLEKLLEEFSSDPYTLNHAAWFLSTCHVDELRDGERAVKYAEQVCEQTNYSSFAYLDTLAAAYAENGQFAVAVNTQQLAIQLGPEEYRQEFFDRLSNYVDERPYRELSPEEKQ